MPDAAGEAASFAVLQQLAEHLRTEVRVITNLQTASFKPLRPLQQTGAHMWCMLDAVDGTLKLAGLCNIPGRARLVNDAEWSAGQFCAPFSRQMPANMHVFLT